MILSTAAERCGDTVGAAQSGSSAPATPIPFNRPTCTGREGEYVVQALRAGKLSGDGPFTQACRVFLQRTLSVPRAFLTTSCTHALEMAALLLDLGPDDEVIVPAFTFVSTANAFVLRGARPVFADVRPDTLNLDETLLAGLISPRTRAIVPVHYGGIGCEMDEILRFAAAHGIAVVEDNAHGLFGQYRGRWLGTFGALATQSFHETKNLTCGEGGALLINDERFIARAEIIREKGTNRSRFFRGEIDKYTWVDLGSSYLPADTLAACLWAQFEDWESIQARRRVIWDRYVESLSNWARANGVQTPTVPPHCTPAYHLFHLLLPDLASRSAFIAHLKQRGIHAVFHYSPLHMSDMGRRFGGRPGLCPVAETVADRLVRLPFYTDLTASDQQRVIDAVCEFG